ncbi:MAG: hypothetical protein HYR96_14815 [Deltaproteobacteria bacterium]|nr:hypothetical protein [Deltaproteobacteria bacterium]MBI3293307.1 hypothetical protein [Deltaproteobacteria bacterium]
MLKNRSLLILFSLVCFSQAARPEAAGTGLQISVAGDIVGNFLGTADNRLLPREGEVVLYAPIDQTWDGALNLAAHNEDGEYKFEIHELTIGSSRLIPRSRFKVGQYFLGVGRLNQTHRHDWPFTSAPKVQTQFLYEEGVNDTGAEYSYLWPTPFYLDLTLGITNGWTFGHTHDEGKGPVLPTHYLRLVTYNDLFLDGGLQTGLNYLGRKDSSGNNTSLFGLDLTAKWREAQTLTFLFQSELWYRIYSPAAGDVENTIGFYAYPQYGFSPSWSLGVRVDGYSVLNSKDAGGNNVGSFDYGLVPTFSYKASEFSTIRASYGVKGRLSQGAVSNTEHFLELQAVFILGSHPAHDF